jgi:hypothetical protein
VKEHENQEFLELVADLCQFEFGAEESGILATAEHLELPQCKSTRIVKAI